MFEFLFENVTNDQVRKFHPPDHFPKIVRLFIYFYFILSILFCFVSQVQIKSKFCNSLAKKNYIQVKRSKRHLWTRYTTRRCNRDLPAGVISVIQRCSSDENIQVNYRKTNNNGNLKNRKKVNASGNGPPATKFFCSDHFSFPTEKQQKKWIIKIVTEANIALSSISPAAKLFFL